MDASVVVNICKLLDVRDAISFLLTNKEVFSKLNTTFKMLFIRDYGFEVRDPYETYKLMYCSVLLSFTKKNVLMNYGLSETIFNRFTYCYYFKYSPLEFILVNKRDGSVFSNVKCQNSIIERDRDILYEETKMDKCYRRLFRRNRIVKVFNFISESRAMNILENPRYRRTKTIEVDGRFMTIVKTNNGKILYSLKREELYVYRFESYKDLAQIITYGCELYYCFRYFHSLCI